MLIKALICSSATCLIVHSEIFRPAREFVDRINKKAGYFMTCPMCMGFWIGVLASGFLDSNFLQLGLLSSLFSWGIYNIITAFGAVGDYYTALTVYQPEERGEENDE